MRWLDFVAFSKGKVIAHAHALYGNGEKKISGVSVNGYCEATNTIFQFHLNFSLLNRNYKHSFYVNYLFIKYVDKKIFLSASLKGLLLPRVYKMV